jgi:DNA (cytosine-5)-methyltransferase 1
MGTIRYKNIKNKLHTSLFNNNYKYVDTKRIAASNTQYNIGDIFSGAGGLTLGFQMAGYNPIFSAELDKDASATYKNNFPNTYHYNGYIQNISKNMALNAIGENKIHILCAGFPCQGFSIAGARNATDKRNQLFKEFIRFTNYFKPWFVVGENVPGIITLNKGKFYDLIINSFKEIGYPNMSVLILESADYGVPQYRPRAIFIANRFGLVNPYPKEIYNTNEHISIENAIDDLKYVPRNPDINHEWTRHSKTMEERISYVKAGGSLYDSYTDAWKRQYKGKPSMTIKENHGGVHIHYELNRTISAREMARLQSFPDSFIFKGRMKRVMFQVGNAVPPLLAYHIGLALKPSLVEIEQLKLGT